MSNLIHLLQQVTIIRKKYDEIAKITGENFNIFSIMRAENDEVRTHSRLIAEFLNPKGIHNQGAVFIKIFFDVIEDLKDIKDSFDYENATVLVEEHIGIIDKDYSEGGYIDIVIKDSKNQVVIENKIYAKDQEGQLFRYKNYYPNCKLIYLTLDGKNPSEFSYKSKNGQELKLEDILLASYATNVTGWIEKCIEKTHSLPLIRETLVQYLYLIKKLTNQTTNKKMEDEILDNILNNPKNIESALTIAGIGTDKIKMEVCKKLFNQIQNKIGNDLFTENYDESVLIGRLESGMWFSKAKDFKIGVLLWFAENFNLMLGIDVKSDSEFERLNLSAINKGIYLLMKILITLNGKKS